MHSGLRLLLTLELFCWLRQKKKRAVLLGRRQRLSDISTIYLWTANEIWNKHLYRLDDESIKRSNLWLATNHLQANSIFISLILCFTANKMEYILFGHLLLIDPFTLILMTIKSSSLKLSKVYFWCYWTWNTPFYLERLGLNPGMHQTVVFFSTPEEYPCACAHLERGFSTLGKVKTYKWLPVLAQKHHGTKNIKTFQLHMKKTK